MGRINFKLIQTFRSYQINNVMVNLFRVLKDTKIYFAILQYLRTYLCHIIFISKYNLLKFKYKQNDNGEKESYCLNFLQM